MWFISHTIASTRKGRIIFVRSRLKIIETPLTDVIQRYVQDPAQVAFIEPGSGLAHISRRMGRIFPWKETQAIEISGGLVLATRLINFCAQTPMRVIKANLFSVDYPKPAVVYSYLSTEIIDRLYREQKLKGCLFISLTFTLTDITPTETIALSNWQKQLFVYDFR